MLQGRANGAKKLCFVGGFHRVEATCRVLPNSVVVNIFLKVEITDVGPKFEKLPEVINKEIGRHFDLVNPCTIIFFRASRTFQFFLVDAAQMRGAMSLGLRFCTQGESQNGVRVPLPTTIVEEA